MFSFIISAWAFLSGISVGRICLADYFTCSCIGLPHFNPTKSGRDILPAGVLNTFVGPYLTNSFTSNFLLACVDDEQCIQADTLMSCCSMCNEISSANKTTVHLYTFRNPHDLNNWALVYFCKSVKKASHSHHVHSTLCLNLLIPQLPPILSASAELISTVQCTNWHHCDEIWPSNLPFGLMAIVCQGSIEVIFMNQHNILQYSCVMWLIGDVSITVVTKS